MILIKEWKKEHTRILIEMNDLEEYRIAIDGGRNNLFRAFSKGEIAMMAGPLFGHVSLRTGLLNYESSLRFWGVDWDIVSFPVFGDDQRLQPADQIPGIGKPERSPDRGTTSHRIEYCRLCKIL